jgi:hypothetical protein
LLGLQHTAGFNLGEDKDATRDERGYCAMGNRYSYDIVDAGNNRIQHLWSTSCKEKTFSGEAGVVQQMFEAQVPGFSDLTTGIDF